MQNFFHGLCRLLINLMAFASFLFMLYTLLAFYSNTKRNSQLLAVQWCDVHLENHFWANQYRGFYLYAEDNGNKQVNIKAQMFDGRNYSVWDNYRLYFTDVIAKEKSVEDARKNWSKLTCLPGGKITAGENGLLIE
ncbi:hypothetical protein [Enterobacter huaxiensis]